MSPLHWHPGRSFISPNLLLACLLTASLAGCRHGQAPTQPTTRQPRVAVKAQDAASVIAAVARVFQSAGYSLVSREALTTVLDRELDAKGQSLFSDGQARSALIERVRVSVVAGSQPGVFDVIANATLISNRSDVPRQNAPGGGRSGESLQRLLDQLPAVVP